MKTILLFIYNALPFKRNVFELLKMIGFNPGILQKYLNFKGNFKVTIDAEHSFLMFNNGGNIENKIFWNGLFVSWENEVGWIWKQLCECSDIVFDVGANTGIYSLVTKCLNPGAEVYAFEPSIRTFNVLAKNNAINNYDIHCEQIAVSNLNGPQTFYDTQNPNQTSASLSPLKLKQLEGYNEKIIEYYVRSTTLSQFISNNNILKVDLIKLDIELHEPEAIEGLNNYLHMYKPIVIVEVLRKDIAQKLNSSIGPEFLKFHLIEENIVKHVDQFEAIPTKWNYLFFHKDLEEKIKKHTTLEW